MLCRKILWLPLALLLSAALLLPDAARAVRVPGVYAAEVDLPSGSNGLREAFDAALEQVLVKVSGRDSLGNAGARRSLVPDAGKLVRQYSRLPRGRVRVEFDGVQLERILDAAGQPVWGIERPLLAVWYAVDDGAGNRTILDGNDTSGRKGRLRAQLQAAADARGLPVVFPLVDAEDLSRMSFADVWGNFTAPLQQASRRYSADGLLIGRARSLSTGERRVRWTVVTRTEQFAWEGSVSGGPGEAASWLSQRLATVADTGGAVRLVVGDINSIDRLGRLQKYLRSLNIVQSAQIVQVRDDRIEFELQVRGDSSRLQRSLDNGRLLSRVTADAAPVAAGARRPDLIYNWASR